MNTLSSNKIYIIGTVSLMLGILFDYLFYDKQVGISFLIYVILLLLSLFGFLFFFKVLFDKTIVLFLPAILFFASMALVRDNEFLLFVNIVLVLGLLLLMAHHLIGRKIRSILFLGYLKTAVLLPLSMLAKSFNALGRMLSVGKGLKKNQKTFQIAKGILITLPIALFFVFLFSSADLAFKTLVTNLFNFNFSVNPDVISQIWLAVAFAVLWLGVYTYILEHISEKDDLTHSPIATRYKFGNIEAAILFATLIVLFLAFVIVQIKYLFAGNAAITELGYTYAEYAHKGFGELIGAALLTFALIFLVERYIERSENKPSTLFKILSSILVMLVLVITASAFMRLNVYEQAYGFTVLRVLVQAFIIWQAAVFLWLGFKIIKDVEDRSFVFGIFLSVIAFFIVFNLLNPDRFVARKNINQFAKTGRLDTKYLSTLSADAVPDLIPLLNSELKDKYGNQLSGEIAVALNGFQDLLDDQSWQSYNLSRSRAGGLIKSKWSLISELVPKSAQGEIVKTKK